MFEKTKPCDVSVSIIFLLANLFRSNIHNGLFKILEERDLEVQLLIAKFEISKLDPHSFALLEFLCDNLHLLSCYSETVCNLKLKRKKEGK